MLSRIKAWLLALVGIVAGVLTYGAWSRGQGRKQEKAKQDENYIETRKRMDEVESVGHADVDQRLLDLSKKKR